MASIVHVESCCSGCSLKTSTIIIGWLKLFGGILGATMSGLGLAAIYYAADHPELTTLEAKQITFLMAVAIIMVLLYLTSYTLAFVLLIGVYQSKANLVVGAAAATLVVIQGLYLVLEFIGTPSINDYTVLVFCCIQLYLTLVAYSFHRKIRNQSSNNA